MLSRRTMIEMAAAALSQAVPSDAQAAPKKSSSKPILQQALPNVELKNWNVNAVEVSYPPGGASNPHQHAGFVLGYVLEGEVRFQLRGQPEKIVRAGEMFF